jgi:hypothetical protein
LSDCGRLRHLLLADIASTTSGHPSAGLRHNC